MKEKKLSRKKKIAISISSSIVAIVAVILIIVNVFPVQTRTVATYMVMPHRVEAPMKAGTLVMEVKLSHKYNVEDIKQQPFAAFEYYYYDLDGKRIHVDYIDDFYFGDEQVIPMVAFAALALERVNTIKSVAKTVGIVLAVVLVIVGIILWFMSWSRREDEAKANANKLNNNKNKKKKK